jgi:hypothetical protein
MPPTANLLSAILARIDDSVRRWSGGIPTGDGEADMDFRPRGLLDVGAGYHDALLELQRLQTDSALAWESNLGERQGHLDPDSYAVEVLRSERARLSINRKIETVLNALARETFRGSDIRSPLFVLPIDDLDLNPLACLDLLKLLRLISVPRLFTVLLGDVRVAELVLNLKVSSDLGRLSGERQDPDLLALRPSVVGAMAGDIAANALRKLLPPSQRVVLSTMSLLEGLNFRPLGHGESDRRLHELLAQCPMVLNEPVHFLQATPAGGMPAIWLRDFLLVEGFAQEQTTSRPPQPTSGPLEVDHLTQCAYTGRRFFETTPRRLADLWLTLLGGVPTEPSRQTYRELTRHFANLCLSSLAGDPALSPHERVMATNAITQNPEGEWEMALLLVRIAMDMDRRPPIEWSQPQYLPYQARILTSASRGWRFEAEGVRIPGERSPRVGSFSGPQPPREKRLLSRETVADLTIFHDLLALGPDAEAFASPFLPVEPQSSWAATEWRSGTMQEAVLPWPTPRFQSFWEYDLFLHAWNQVAREPHGTDWDRTLKRLVYVWVNVSLALIEGRAPEPMQTVPDLTKLVPRLHGVVKRVRSESAARATLIKEWLIDLALLLMPETGLPIDFLSSTPRRAQLRNLQQFWEEQRPLILRGRALRLAELVYQGMEELAEHLRTAQVPFGRFEPPPELVSRLAGMSPPPPPLPRPPGTRR